MNRVVSGKTIVMNTHDTSRESTQGSNDRHMIATYVSDLLALERHIARPIAAQRKSNDSQNYASAFAIIARIETMTGNHIGALEAHLATIGGHEASALKSAWATLLGDGVAAVETLRKPKISKSLRDDYTALGLAAISYTMLNATALGLGDSSTASLAKRHLDDLTPFIVEISKTMPTVVLEELREDGEDVRILAAQLSEMQTGESWSSAKTGA
jgi:ferritin-like metal-binding protein YciE